MIDGVMAKLLMEWYWSDDEIFIGMMTKFLLMVMAKVFFSVGIAQKASWT